MVSQPLELDLQTTVSYLMWVLGANHTGPLQEQSTAILPVLIYIFLIYSFSHY